MSFRTVQCDYGGLPLLQARPRSPRSRCPTESFLQHGAHERPPEGPPASQRLELRALVEAGQRSRDTEVKEAALPTCGASWSSARRAPVSFEWSGATTRTSLPPEMASLTPREFFDRYVDVDLTQYVCLVDDPRREHPRVIRSPWITWGTLSAGAHPLRQQRPGGRPSADHHPILASGRAVPGADCGQQSTVPPALLICLTTTTRFSAWTSYVEGTARRVGGVRDEPRGCSFTGVDIDEAGHRAPRGEIPE